MQDNETVAEGLGLDEEWAILNKHRSKKWIETSEEMSEAVLKAIKDVKHEEFGETGTNISDYEKKLIMTGMHLGHHSIMRVLAGLGNFFMPPPDEK